MSGVAREGGEDLQLRPPVRRLPPKVRSPDREGDPGSCRGPPGPKQPALRCGQQPDEETEGEEQHVPLVLEPDPNKHPDAGPEPQVAGSDQANNQQKSDGPDEPVEDGRADQVRARKILFGQRHRQSSQALPEAPGAELSGKERAQDHEREHGKGGDHSKPRERARESGVCDAGQDRGEGRLIHVAEREMPRAFDEVELVAVVAVAGAHRHLQQERRGSEGEDRPGHIREEASARDRLCTVHAYGFLPPARHPLGPPCLLEAAFQATGEALGQAL